MNAKHIFIGSVVLLLLFSFGCLSNSGKTTTTGTQHTVAKTPQNTKSMNGKGSKAKTNQSKQSEMSAGNHKGWKTYRDAAYGYTIRYPKNWTVIPYGKSIEVQSPVIDHRADLFQLGCTKNKSITKLSDLVSYIKHSTASTYRVKPTVENQTINGLTVPVVSLSVYLIGPTNTTIKEYLFWNKKTQVYCIASACKDPSTKDAVYKKMQQIIGTFQFQ